MSRATYSRYQASRGSRRSPADVASATSENAAGAPGAGIVITRPRRAAASASPGASGGADQKRRWPSEVESDELWPGSSSATSAGGREEPSSKMYHTPARSAPSFVSVATIVASAVTSARTATASSMSNRRGMGNR